MYYNRFSRRLFLQGSGSVLAIPFLQSLSKQAYGADVPVVRYVQFLSSFGQYPAHFYPPDTGLKETLPGILTQPLASIAGDLSTVFGSEFTPFKNKMSILRGLHVFSVSQLHNGSFPTCASGSPEDNEANGRPVYPYSVDDLIASSNKVYPNATGKQRHVNICPAPGSYKNFSWTKKNGSVEHLPNTTTTASLIEKLAPTTNQNTTSPSPDTLRKRDLIQAVYADYKNLRDGAKISMADKQLLETYMSLIDEVQRGLASTTEVTGAICTPPVPEAESQTAAIHRNQAKALVAAMACGLTRVASYVLSVPYDPMHDYSHHWDQQDKHAAAQKQLGRYVAYTMKLMEEFKETTGSLLDNSVIYWGNEFGENTGDPHQYKNMTAMVAGGAAGQLQQGNYVDYRKSDGRPLNNLLVTFMNSMGLSSADYERDGLVGIGDYNRDAVALLKMGAYTSTAERRKPLPFLYKGVIKG